jgi:pimeloyl-ACP methyl ester carboxylesterase
MQKEIVLPTITTNGVTLTYQTEGDPNGTPMLLIMGLGMQLTSWPETFIDGLLEHGFYLIRFDNRDSGLSTSMDHLGKANLPLAFIKNMLRLPVSSAYALADMARDAIGLLDALGLAKVHLVGVSMGGMIAQIVAAQHPERVLTLTSIMSSSGGRGLPGPTTAARRAMMRGPRNPHDREQVIKHYLHTFKTIGSPGFPTPEPELRERVLASLTRSQNTAGVARQMVAIVADEGRAHLLKKIKARTLVIHGADDPLVPLACGEDTAQRIPGAVLRVINGMGHDLAAPLNPIMVRLIEAHCAGKTLPEF